MSARVLVFAHHLVEVDLSPALNLCNQVALLEERLFFRQYAFHKQKLLFHRASMKAYEAYLKRESCQVEYIEAKESRADVRVLVAELSQEGVQKLHCLELDDDWLEMRLKAACAKAGVELQIHPSPLFLNQPEDLSEFFLKQTHYRQTSFY